MKSYMTGEINTHYYYYSVCFCFSFTFITVSSNAFFYSAFLFPLFFSRFMLFLLMIVSEIGKIILNDSYNQFLSVRCNLQKTSFSDNKLFMPMIFYCNSLDYLDTWKCHKQYINLIKHPLVPGDDIGCVLNHVSIGYGLLGLYEDDDVYYILWKLKSARPRALFVHSSKNGLKKGRLST